MAFTMLGSESIIGGVLNPCLQVWQITEHRLYVFAGDVMSGGLKD